MKRSKSGQNLSSASKDTLMMESRIGNVSSSCSNGKIRCIVSRRSNIKVSHIFFQTVILLHTHIPNAFVSEMLPQRVFVTTGLFDHFVKSDDELAMILGHELSHLVLGHGKERLLVDFMLRGLEIAILMLDPTEGLLSLGVAGFLASSREALTANTSRETENEADELGCTFAAMACYDTKSGSQVFHRMHEFDVKHGHEKRDLMSSHPASKERYEFVKNLSQEVNPEYYSVCGKLAKKLRGRALSLTHEMPR
mmetsp:Transcript_40550/g.97866  ORF Transcript_40550/g.97866 Transcript_40550/m.97866 type:complete len:252 (-) Transcript_40550:493-1248(-)